jgi:hypothetical protein
MSLIWLNDALLDGMRLEDVGEQEIGEDSFEDRMSKAKKAA